MNIDLFSRCIKRLEQFNPCGLLIPDPALYHFESRKPHFVVGQIHAAASFQIKTVLLALADYAPPQEMAKLNLGNWVDLNGNVLAGVPIETRLGRETGDTRAVDPKQEFDRIFESSVKKLRELARKYVTLPLSDLPAA
jgi:hypothetical protein